MAHGMAYLLENEQSIECKRCNHTQQIGNNDSGAIDQPVAEKYARKEIHACRDAASDDEQRKLLIHIRSQIRQEQYPPESWRRGCSR